MRECLSNFLKIRRSTLNSRILAILLVEILITENLLIVKIMPEILLSKKEKSYKYSENFDWHLLFIYIKKERKIIDTLIKEIRFKNDIIFKYYRENGFANRK
jgi:hypothetical protein